MKEYSNQKNASSRNIRKKRKGFVKNETESHVFATLSQGDMSSDDEEAEGEHGKWVSRRPKYRRTTLTLFLNKYVTRI